MKHWGKVLVAAKCPSQGLILHCENPGEVFTTIQFVVALVLHAFKTESTSIWGPQKWRNR